MRFLLLGNPENRRVGLFQEALARQSQPPAEVIAWRDFLDDPAVLERASDEPRYLRIDSFGENPEVERQLLLRGFEAAQAAGCSLLTPSDIRGLPYEYGRILAPRQHHLGVEQALGQIEEIVAGRPRWRVQSAPASIRELFDKRVVSRRCHDAGIPVPRAFHGIAGRAALDAALDVTETRSVYIKLSCSSSASCLALYSRAGSRPVVMTTMELAGDKMFNSLRVRRYEQPAAVERLLSFLLSEGSQIEESVPKARLESSFFDCRVLCIAGRAVFTVVRQSKHPITNLHLGGKRGSLDALTAAAPPDVFAAAMRSCERVAGLYDCLHVGVDVLFERGYMGYRLLEANAFGDLLPNLWRDGLSVYEWEIRAALSADDG